MTKTLSVLYPLLKWVVWAVADIFVMMTLIISVWVVFGTKSYLDFVHGNEGLLASVFTIFAVCFLLKVFWKPVK